MSRQRPLKKPVLFLILLAASLMAAVAYADCTNPAGKEADMVYNNDYHTYQFCNGTSWLAFGGGSNCTASGTYSPTTPSGHGYFVLTSTTYNGNLGGVGGADALCLTELTTNTGWMGYSTASANGQLIADKVHAWLCDGDTCNDLMPLTQYYFANAGNSSAGGASFTTDSDGLGPNDNADWSAANYFSGTYTFWTGRATGTSTQWAGTQAPSLGAPCNPSGNSGFITTSYSANTGISSQTGTGRWDNTSNSCSTAEHLICFVNP